ncbi:PAS domain-containing protein [Streptomyces sp. Tu 6176]|uniref:PAS domain-containing protein n=1 Tax=Streptomyces sp. Tu 6176 TaxID=1470557 RepID=UPI000AE0CFC1|nr:PAS domain-containing protein [Streptomyces sp. Tu 6176]
MGVGGAANSAFPGDPLDVTSVPAAVAVVDADGLIVRWSRAAQDLVGHPPSEVLRSPVGALLADADPAAVVSRLRRIRRGWQGTVRVRHRAGHTVRLAVRVAPLSGGPKPSNGSSPGATRPGGSAGSWPRWWRGACWSSRRSASGCSARGCATGGPTVRWPIWSKAPRAARAAPGS